jgi:hypothetical protein
MGAWNFTKTTGIGGRFQLVITKLTSGGRAVDVTLVRGAPTQLGSFSSADPFGDSTAVFSFPAITPFDDLDAADLGRWLGYYSNVDLYWVPGIAIGGAGAGGEEPVINALTNQLDLITPSILRAGAMRLGDNRIKVWEGFLAAMDFTADGTNASLEVQCQGALFQLDRYLQKPFYPPQPWPLELLIADAFSHTRKPHLRTGALQTVFPAGWKNIVPAYTGASVYTPVAKPGSKWSGYASRQTGSWDHALTGFIQDQLTVMLTDAKSGVTPGNQWTVQHVRQSTAAPAGRRPVLLVRDRFRAPDFSLWLGTHGVDVSLNGDSTQSENVIYGDGTDIDGTVWRNAVISNDGKRTDYLPLAASRDVYPPSKQNLLSREFISEAYTKFGSGFSQTQAQSSAAQQMVRDEQPGWSGTITLRTDPSLDLPRWLIRAGMTVRLKGFLGTGETGMPLHISAVSANPMDGSVALTVDTRYRDLLTVEESLARTRDPLTPIKMLQVNRTSVLIEDIQAPWDYSAGSGYVPKASKAFHDYKPAALGFPYLDWRTKHPPLHYPSWYVKCNAGAAARKSRWAGPIPILTSEKDTVIRTEFAVCDLYGRALKIPFHVSLYYVNVTQAAMPRDRLGPDPYINGAFESVNPATGQPWPAGNFLAPDQSFIVGWGNRSGGVYNRAGFYPNRESGGAPPTGLFVDDASWSFDNTNNPNYNKLAKPGQRQKASAITIYAMFYCEHPSPVYFHGRLYRQNPGVS